ncbi:uncharacterized protein LOC132786384 [Drosophila nasuta]|uniref:Uncharacterized protein LOC127566118 n=1 Tax=Drosophila albomicans TaxID=7291 RepID=A0A9C6T918_DROAB|nr:uncharacterized protein LOC127566118 [Drosophila albomicans]XP_060648880.1 uncharacterized protein LOC132786384 [Drosophila nasuta]
MEVSNPDTSSSGGPKIACFVNYRSNPEHRHPLRKICRPNKRSSTSTAAVHTPFGAVHAEESMYCESLIAFWGLPYAVALHGGSASTEDDGLPRANPNGYPSQGSNEKRMHGEYPLSDPVPFVEK